MDEIAKGARRAVAQMENNGFVGFIEKYALNAQRGDFQGMAKVTETLEKISAENQAIHRRIEQIEKTTSSLSSTNTTQTNASSASSAVIWHHFRMNQWQGGLPYAGAPSNRSNGTSSPGIGETELSRGPRSGGEGPRRIP